MIKHVKENCLRCFGINVFKSIIVLSKFGGGGEGGRTQWNLGKVVIILSVIPIVFVLMNGHLVFYEDRKQTLEEPWGKIDSVI